MAKVKVTVIDKKCYPELQKKYCMDPDVGLCPMFEVCLLYTSDAADEQRGGVVCRRRVFN